MQYIKKQNTPPDAWEDWFKKATGERSYDYRKDSGSMRQLLLARDFLINEQHGLCAYCQQSINESNSSIEHVVPKELNVELSTNYHNLVAVCKTQLKDPGTGRMHCDDEKGSKVITPFIFFFDSEATQQKNNQYFKADSNGKIEPKKGLSEELTKQVEAFIEVVNLNHSVLMQKRSKDIFGGLLDIYRSLPTWQKGTFWKEQYQRILKNPKQPFRQYLLIVIGTKIGIN